MVGRMLKVNGEVRSKQCEGCMSTELGPDNTAQDKVENYLAVLLRILFLLYHFKGISQDCALKTF